MISSSARFKKRPVSWLYSKRTAFLVALLLAAAAWRWGYVTQGQMVDAGAENQAVNDAKLIAEGSHAYGIVSYSHFPNGPSYLLVPLIWLHMDEDWALLRLLPISISALTFGFFSFVFYLYGNSLLKKIWTIVFLVGFLLQPAFYSWQGALHEHGYALSLVLITLSVALMNGRRLRWVIVLIGFISGWIGYDFIPGQLILLLTVRAVRQSQIEKMSFMEILHSMWLDAAAFASGAAAALFGHLLQDALAFGGFSKAFSDLFGSAAMRMGLKSEDAFRAVYNEAGPFIGTYDALGISSGMFDSFLWGTQSPWGSGIVYDGAYHWVNIQIFLPVLLFSVFYACGATARSIIEKPFLWWRRVLTLSLGWLGAVGSSCVWFFLMSHHAANHLIFLPRHFLMGFLICGVLPLLLGRANQTSPLKR